MIRAKKHSIARVLCLTLLAAGLLSACGSSSREKAPVSTAPGEEVSPTGRIGTLPPQPLEAGQCGLFLWSKLARPSLIFFSLAESATGRMNLNDRVIDLPRVAAEGQPFFGHPARQTFEGEAGTVTLTIQPERRSGIVGGAVVQRGSLKLEAADGWSVIVPVGGMIACQN